MTVVNLEALSIIVVEPETPGNIGSIARACKNCGISSIILVNPCEFDCDETYRFGKNAKDLIQKIKVVSSLEDCLADHHILVGTTQRIRKHTIPFYSPKEVVEKVAPETKRHRVGLVFGRESMGLTSEELALCNVHSTISGHDDNPVFNLSQAVLIYAYEFLNSSSLPKRRYDRELATKEEEAVLLESFNVLLKNVPCDQDRGVVVFSRVFRRLFGRVGLEKRDVRVLHKLIYFFNGGFNK